jgi:hypothetical protein
MLLASWRTWPARSGHELGRPTEPRQTINALDDMTRKLLTERCRWRLRALVKTIVLIPVWLVILPIRQDKVFRHYEEPIERLAHSPFSRTAYAFSICWIALIAAIAFEIHEFR